MTGGDDATFVVEPGSGVVYVDADLSGIRERTFIYHVLVIDHGVPPLSTAASLTLVVNSTVPVPPPSVDDYQLGGGNVTSDSSARRGSFLSSSNFIAVVTVAATTLVVAVVLVAAIVYVVCRYRWHSASAHAGSAAARQVYKPSNGDALGKLTVKRVRNSLWETHRRAAV